MVDKDIDFAAQLDALDEQDTPAEQPLSGFGFAKETPAAPMDFGLPESTKRLIDTSVGDVESERQRQSAIDKQREILDRYKEKFQRDKEEKFGPQHPEVKPEDDFWGGEFFRSVGRAGVGTKDMLGATMRQSATSLRLEGGAANEALAGPLEQRGQQYSDEAERITRQLPKARIDDFTKIRTESISAFARDVNDYVQQGVGQVIGYYAPIAVGYGVAGVPGLFLGSTVLGVGEVRKTLEEEGITDPKLLESYGWTAGMTVAALDALVPAELLTAPVKKGLQKYALTRIARTMAEIGVKEAVTETMQEMVQITAAASAAGIQVGEDRASEELFNMGKALYEKRWQVANAAALGFIGGKTLAAPGAIQAEIAGRKADRLKGFSDAAKPLAESGATIEPDTRTIAPSQEGPTPRLKPGEGAVRGPVESEPAIADAEQFLRDLETETPSAPGETATDRPAGPSAEPGPSAAAETMAPAPVPTFQDIAPLLKLDKDGVPDFAPVFDALAATGKRGFNELTDQEKVGLLQQLRGETPAAPKEAAQAAKPAPTTPEGWIEFATAKSQEYADLARRMSMGEMTREEAEAAVAAAKRDWQAIDRARTRGIIEADETRGRPHSGAVETAYNDLRTEFDVASQSRRGFKASPKPATAAPEAVSAPEAATVAPAQGAAPAAPVTQTGQSADVTRNAPRSLTEAIQQAAPQIEEVARAAVQAIAAPAQETAAAPSAPAIDDAVRSRFSEVLASKERRSNWAKAAGISEDQAQALIAEAVSDGRLTMRKGQPVRTGKAKQVSSPQAEVARAATSVPMGRAAEVRLERIQNDIAYKHAATLLGAGTNTRLRNVALKKLAEDKKATRVVLDEVHLALTGKPSKSMRKKGDVIEALRKAEIAQATPAPVAVPVVEEESVPLQDIVNPIDRNAPVADQLRQIAELKAQSKPALDGQLKAMDAQIGTTSNSNIKKPETIVSKASRPSILATKPWHTIAHIRDTLRFQTKITSFDQIEKAAEFMLSQGYRIVKIDTAKMLQPKEWGWRFAGFDLRAPNGQLVEWYIIFDQMYVAKKKGHLLFEKWRNSTEAERTEKQDEYEADIASSYRLYTDSFEAGLRNSGYSGLDDARADISRLSASLPEMAAKFSATSSAAGGTYSPLGSQAPSAAGRNLEAPGSGSMTQQRPESRSSSTTGSSISDTSSTKGRGVSSSEDNATSGRATASVQKFADSVDALKRKLDIKTRPVRDTSDVTDISMSIRSVESRALTLVEQVNAVQRGSRIKVVAEHVAGFTADANAIAEVVEQKAEVDLSDATIADLEAYQAALSELGQIVENRSQVGYKLADDVQNVRDQLQVRLEGLSDQLTAIADEADSKIYDISDLGEAIAERIEELRGDTEVVDDGDNTETILSRPSAIKQETDRVPDDPESSAVDFLSDMKRSHAVVLATMTQRADALLKVDVATLDEAALDRLSEEVGNVGGELVALKDWANRFAELAATKGDEAYNVVDTIHDEELTPANDRLDDARDTIARTLEEVDELIIDAREMETGDVIEIDGGEYGPTMVRDRISAWRDWMSKYGSPPNEQTERVAQSLAKFEAALKEYEGPAAPPADSYAIRTLQSIDDPVVKGHYEALARSGTAVEPALGAIASDRRLDAGERQQLAELYVGEPVSGDPVEAIRSAAERRGNDLTSALLHGFSPEVSPSNLRVRDFDAQMLETAFQRLAERLPNDALLAVRDALRLDVGDEIAALEGAALSAKAARVEFGINAGAAKKVIAISLEYGPDTALRTFTHEEIHLLRGMGILKGKDWEALAGIAKRRPKKAEATRILDGLIADGKISQESYDTLIGQAGKLTYRELYEVDSRYGDFVKFNEDKLIEETVAHAAADWADGRQFAAPIERVFMKIRDFLEAIQNALNGLGFRSANDIFESIWAGEFVRKFEEAEAKRAEGIESTREWMGENGVIAMAVGPRPAIGEVWGTKFQTLMSEQYQIAVAGEDLATQYDILSAKYNNALSDPPEMREAMKAEIDRLRPIVEAQEAELRADLKRRFSNDDGSAPPMIMAAFAGERATTADLNALNAAKEMDAAGEPREDIWKQTGWFKGVDGRWRFEIDDSKSKLRAFGPDFSLLQVELTHEELFKAYPQMAEVEFDRIPGNGGSFTPGGILPSTMEIGKAAKNRRSVTLHESQHGLQDIEGFARGGSPRYVTPDEIRAEQQRIRSTPMVGNGWTEIDNRDPDDEASIRHALYQRLSGEVEARTVEKRLSLTPQQRANRAPWLDYDVPESQQIVRMPDGSGQAMASIRDWIPGLRKTADAVATDYRQIATDKPVETVGGFEVRRTLASKRGGINYEIYEGETRLGDLMIDAPRHLQPKFADMMFASNFDRLERKQPIAGTVTRIDVNEDRHGQGIGTIMLDVAEADLRSAGAILHPGDTSMTEDFIRLYAKRDPAILQDSFDRMGLDKYDDRALMLDHALRERSRRAPPDISASFRDWLPSRGPTPPQATEQGDSPGLNKIISDLKTSLGMTVNQGLWGTTLRQGKRTMRIRPPSNITGQYDRETGNISIRQSRDIKTLAHEGGHLLETLLGNELATLKAQRAQELTGRPVASGSEISEAFADWFRSYVLDRAAAEKQAPTFAREFDDLLEAERPDLLVGLQEVSDQYQTYVKSAPLDQVTADMVTDYESGFVKEIMEHPNGVPDALMNTVSGWLSTSYSGLVDALHPIQMAVRRLLDIAERNGMVDADGRPLSIKDAEDPYKIIRMFAGAYNRGRVWLEKGVSDLSTGRIIGPSLKDALEKALGGRTWSKKRFKEFNSYLVALRAIEEYNALENRDLTIAKHDSLLQRMGEARTTLSAKSQQEQATLDRREDALTRAQAMLRDRRRMLRRIETSLENTQERLDGLRNDLAQADADTAPRRRRSVQIAERDQQRLLREAEALVEEVAELDIEIGLLEPEIAQRRDGVQRLRDQRTQLDAMEANVQRERKFTEARPKNPPTKEDKGTHERIINELGTPEFQEAARMVHEFAFSLLTVQHQAGFWTDEQFAALSKRKDWYVPFQRDMSDVEGAAAKYAGSMAWTKAKKYKGSDRAIITPMAILSQDAYRTAQRIAFNNFVKALVQLSERVGPGGGAIAERLEREIGQLDPSQQNFDRLVEIGIRSGLNTIDAQMLAQRAELNLSSKDIIKVLVSPENLGPGEKASLPLWERGERITVRLPDAQLGYDMANAINAIGMDNQDLWTSIFGKAANMLRVGVTTSFDFIGANIFRDMWAAWKVTGAAPILTHIRGANILLGRGDVGGVPAADFQRQYNEMGGIAGGININAQSATQQRDVRDLLGTEIKFKSVLGGTIVGGAFGAGLVGILGGAAGLLLGGPVGGLVGLAAAKTTGFAVGGAIGGYAGRHGEVFKMVESAETAARLGVAAHAYKRIIAYDPSLSQSEAMFQAVFDTRDYLDWSRRGSKTFAVARAIPFWLSAVNGLTKTLQQGVAWGPRGSGVARQIVRTDSAKALKGVLERRLGIVWKHQTGDILSKDEEAELSESYKSYARWAGLTMITVMMILAGMSSMGDDEDDVRDEAKFKERFIRINGVDVRLPGVFELDMPAIALRIIYDAQTGGDDRWVRRLGRAAFELVAPPMGITAIDALTGVAFNSRIGGRPIVGPYLANKPPQDQFDAYTSQVSRDFAKAMADAGVPQAMILPPKKLDHLMTTLGGSWGRDSMGFYEDAKRAADLNDGPAKKATDIPVVRRFTTDSARLSRSVQEFWNMATGAGGEMTVAATGYRDRVEGERPADADIWLSRLDKDQKVWALTQYHGSKSDKREHPLTRLDSSMDAIRSVQDDIILDRLAPKERQGRRKVRDFSQEIHLTPEKKREIVDILTRAQQIEARNTMILLERPGFKHMQIKDPKLIWDELKASSPLVYEHMQDVQQNKKIEDWPSVQREWPRYRERVLKQGVEAF